MEKPTESSTEPEEQKPNPQKSRRKPEGPDSASPGSRHSNYEKNDEPVQEEGSGPDMDAELPDNNGHGAAEAFRASQSARFEGSRIDRHQKGTEQVGKILAWAHITSSMLLILSVLLAIIVFCIGARIITLAGTAEAIPAQAWYSYLLILAPVTLLAILGITVWVTGLKFSAQIYNGATETGSSPDELTNNCLKLAAECVKQNSP